MATAGTVQKSDGQSVTKGLGTKLCATAQELLLDIKVGRLFDSGTRPEPSWQDRPSPQTAWTLPRSSRHLVPTYTFNYFCSLLSSAWIIFSPYLYFITFIYSFTSSPHSLLSRIALYSGDSYPGPLRHHHLLRRHPLGEASSFLSMHLVFISEINVYNPYLSFI